MAWLTWVIIVWNDVENDKINAEKKPQSLTMKTKEHQAMVIVAHMCKEEKWRLQP